MRTSLFHKGDIKTSARLRFGVQILKEAGWPLTVMEAQLESQRRGGWLANPGTTFGEIAANEGYQMSDGRMFGQKAGPAVKFPDGKYRYWLISAPGWKQTWMVTRAFKVVPSTEYKVQGTECGVQGTEYEVQSEDVRDSDTNEPKYYCMACGKQIFAGLPWCDDECRLKWKEKRGIAVKA